MGNPTILNVQQVIHDLVHNDSATSHSWYLIFGVFVQDHIDWTHNACGASAKTLNQLYKL